MNHKVTLTITSLLTVLFASFHLADDVVRGFSPGGLANITVLVIIAVWLYATLVLIDRRSGHIVILVGSILGAYAPYLHMRGAGMVGGRITNSGGKFFWVWTLLALGGTAMFCALLAARGLWNLRRGRMTSAT